MKVLSIAPHPDDETLGCGGTLLKHAWAGASLHWLLLTAAMPEQYSASQREQGALMVERVKDAYPFASLDWLRFPTTRLEVTPLNDLIGAIRGVVERVKPDVVYVPHTGDVHSDHRVAADACLAVLKSFYLKSLGVTRVLSCEVMSETDASLASKDPPFRPTVFVDINDTLERKLEIFSMFHTEVHPEPGPRSLSAVRAQARLRGSTVGCTYAEAFMLLSELG